MCFYNNSKFISHKSCNKDDMIKLVCTNYVLCTTYIIIPAVIAMLFRLFNGKSRIFLNGVRNVGLISAVFAVKHIKGKVV